MEVEGEPDLWFGASGAGPFFFCGAGRVSFMLANSGNAGTASSDDEAINLHVPNKQEIIPYTKHQYC